MKKPEKFPGGCILVLLYLLGVMWVGFKITTTIFIVYEIIYIIINLLYDNE